MELHVIFFAPLLQPFRPGENTDPFRLAESITSLFLQNARLIIVRARLRDERRGHPHHVHLDAFSNLVLHRMFKVKEVGGPLEVIFIQVTERYDVEVVTIVLL